MNVIVIVRLVLCAALLFGVYTETGIWTTTALFLLIVASEIRTLADKDADE